MLLNILHGHELSSSSQEGMSVLSAMLRLRNFTAHKQQHFTGIMGRLPPTPKPKLLINLLPQVIHSTDYVSTDKRQASAPVPLCQVPPSFQEEWTDDHPKSYKMVLIIKAQLQCLAMRQFSLDAKALNPFLFNYKIQCFHL